jgi:hypothetical protein
MTSRQIERLADHVAIIALYSEFAHRVDSKDFLGYADLYTSGGRLVVPWRDPIPQAEIAEIAASRLGQWARTHHMVTNHRTVVDGDSACSTAYVQATHMRSENIDDAWVLGGRYECSHQRVVGEWKFESLALHYVWSRGVGSTSVEQDA